MYFESFEAFIAMGKHGPYVWSAYGFSVALVVLELVRAWRRHAQVLKQLRRQQRRQSQTQE